MIRHERRIKNEKDFIYNADAGIDFSLAACGGSDQSGGDTTAENAEKSEESGDSSSEDGTVEITYATWGMETEMQEMVDLYNASQNQVHVTLQVTPLSEYGTLMNEVLGTEEGPDVLWAGLQTRLWGNAGMLAELQDKVTEDQMDLSVFMEYPLKQNYVGIHFTEFHVIRIPMRSATIRLFLINTEWNIRKKAGTGMIMKPLLKN